MQVFTAISFHQFHDFYTELDLHRIMSGFHGAFATGVASQQGTLTLPDTWFRPPFLDLLGLQLLRPNSSNLPCLYSTFHLEYPLVLSRFYLSLFHLILLTILLLSSRWFCSPPPLIWDSVLLHVRSLKGGCCSISGDSSWSYIEQQSSSDEVHTLRIRNDNSYDIRKSILSTNLYFIWKHKCARVWNVLIPKTLNSKIQQSK